MAAAKTVMPTFRIEPGLKGALCTAAGQEHRSIANMVEVMIRDYCGRNGVAIPEQHQPVSARQTAKTNQNKSPRAKRTA